MSAPVFLSFASSDRKAAETICKAVEQRGFECWIATRNIAPGDNFQESITRAIRTAKVMILVFSAHANNSLEVKKEIALAGRYNVIVVPVRVEDVVPNDALSYELAVRQWIDLFDDWENAIERLISQVSTVVQAIPVGAAAVTASTADDNFKTPEPKSKARPTGRRPLLPILAGAIALLVLIAGGLAWRFWPAGGVAEKSAAPATPKPPESPADRQAEKPPPASPSDTLAARVAAAAPKLEAKRRDELVNEYMAVPEHKGFAVTPGGAGSWRAWNRPTREVAAESTLEGCQSVTDKPAS